jgi:hypothetical protein
LEFVWKLWLRKKVQEFAVLTTNRWRGKICALHLKTSPYRIPCLETIIGLSPLPRRKGLGWGGYYRIRYYRIVIFSDRRGNSYIVINCYWLYSAVLCTWCKILAIHIYALKFNEAGCSSLHWNLLKLGVPTLKHTYLFVHWNFVECKYWNLMPTL